MFEHRNIWWSAEKRGVDFGVKMRVVGGEKNVKKTKKKTKKSF